MSDTHVWMYHEDSGNHAAFPIGAIQFWTPRGWVPSEPPPEIDPTKSHLAFAGVTADVDTTVPEPVPAQATAPDSKPAKSGKAGADTGAGE